MSYANLISVKMKKTMTQQWNLLLIQVWFLILREGKKVWEFEGDDFLSNQNLSYMKYNRT